MIRMNPRGAETSEADRHNIHRFANLWRPVRRRLMAKSTATGNILTNDFTGATPVYVGERYDTGKVLYSVGGDGLSKGRQLGYAYEYALSTLTVDIGVVTKIHGSLFAILVKRGGDPYKGCWALPGGFVDIKDREPTKKAAARELKEETDIELDLAKFKKIYVKGSPDRDPRGYTTTLLYGAFVIFDFVKADYVPGSDVVDARWVELDMDNFIAMNEVQKEGGEGRQALAYEFTKEERIITSDTLRGRKIPMAFDHAHLCRKLMRHYEKTK